MRSRYKFIDDKYVYFVTCTIIEWIPALIRPAASEIILDSLSYCRANRGLKLHAYVVMDNHVHLLVQGENIGAVIQAFKRHTAKQLLDEARLSGNTWLLNQFHYHKAAHKTNSTNQVWQEGVHPQEIMDDAMLLQKMEYIHNNPVKRGWVDLPEHWRFSSARNYLLGDQRVLEIDMLD